MTKSKSSLKRSFILSLTSLILCVAMLLGTTFAWFSETITSGKNTIKSGNLDIELEYYKVDKTTGNGDWEKVSGATDIFDPNALWEPGYTEVVYFRLSNVGSLAIKYHLGINIVNEVAGTNVNGERFNLSDYIKFGVTDVDAVNKFENRADAVDEVDAAATKLSANYSESGTMEKQTHKLFAVVLYMPTSVGNEANYMSGTTPPSIDLGVNLIATQEEFEGDSFGTDYDESAPWTGDADTTWYDADPTATEFTLTTTEQLAGLAEIVNSSRDTFAGQTIKLDADLDLSNIPWTPIGSNTNKWNSKFAGTFLGQGHTITNLRVVGGSGLGLFGYIGTGVHIEKLNVKGAYVSGNDYVGVIAGYAYLSTECIRDCTVEDATVIATPYLKADGVTYDGGAKAGVIVGYALNGHVVNNTAKNSSVTAYRDLGGIAGMLARDGGTVEITASGNTVTGVSLSYVTVMGAYADNKPNENMNDIVGRLGAKASVGTNSGEANKDKSLHFVVSNDEELATVLAKIKKDAGFWNEDVTITALAGVYSADHVISQYPEWNGVIGAGSSANNHASLNGNENVLNVTIIGENTATFARAAVAKETVFTGNVKIEGFGNAGTGFGNAKATTTFVGVSFDAINSADEEDAADAVSVYVKAAANNVSFNGCTFRNATHVILGGSGADAVGKATFEGCTFNDGGCLSGYYETLVVTGCTVNAAKNGFINKSKAGTVTVTDSVVNAGKYFIRTSNSGVSLVVEETDITVYESEGLKHLVYFRGSSESASFTNCEIADGYTTAGVDADSSLAINTYTIENGVTLKTDEISGVVTVTKVDKDAPATIVIPEGATALGNKVLQNNTTIKEVVIPESMTDFGGTPNAEGTGASGGFFYQSAVEKVTLPEGLTEIPAATFNQAANLKSVNIPSTVTKIGINAFAGSGLTTLTISDNVKEIGYGAFRDMDSLTSIVIEGDVYIPTYAFRDCSNLKEVYLTGKNVTFGPGMIFSVTSTNNENPNGITVYVANEAIKARLEATGEFKGTIKLVDDHVDPDVNGNYGGENGEPTYAYASNGNELMAHINKAVKPKIVYLSAGDYSIRFEGNYSTDVEGMTIIGSGDVKLSISSSEVGYGRIHLDNVKFENINFVDNTVGAMGAATYVNCVFDGRLEGASDNRETYAVGCTMYNIHTSGDIGSGLITAENCTITHLEYANSSSNGGMRFIGCKIGEILIWSGNTVIENCDIDVSDIAAYDGAYTVIIDDEYYVAGATMLNTAVAAGANTIYLLKSEFKMPSNGVNRNITIVGTEGAVLDLTLGAYWDQATLTFEGVTFKTGTGKANGNGSDYAALYSQNITYNECVFEGPMRVGRDGAKFVQCSFTKLGNDYVWTYGNDVEFDRCKFYSDGKAILIYSDGGDEVAEVSVKGCEFYATAGAKAGAIANQNCAAIEIDNYGKGVNLVTEGNTIGENFSGEWRVKSYVAGDSVTVNGTVYTQIAIDGKLMTIDSGKNVTVIE